MASQTETSKYMPTMHLKRAKTCEMLFRIKTRVIINKSDADTVLCLCLCLEDTNKRSKTFADSRGMLETLSRDALGRVNIVSVVLSFGEYRTTATVGSRVSKTFKAASVDSLSFWRAAATAQHKIEHEVHYDEKWIKRRRGDYKCSDCGRNIDKAGLGEVRDQDGNVLSSEQYAYCQGCVIYACEQNQIAQAPLQKCKYFCMTAVIKRASYKQEAIFSNCGTITRWTPTIEALSPVPSYGFSIVCAREFLVAVMNPRHVPPA